ncbi:MAG: IS3 family transposase [Eubacterium sp.]|uniref:IS3 family transposase n=1 Tax=Eubacterium sp. TaxID=142586 RepID=UPI0039962B64
MLTAIIITEITIIKKQLLLSGTIPKKEDKYTLLRVRVIELFTENKGRYGYRRIHALLKRENIIVSRKSYS